MGSKYMGERGRNTNRRKKKNRLRTIRSRNSKKLNQEMIQRIDLKGEMSEMRSDTYAYSN